MRTADKPDYAGLLQYRQARTTLNAVGVYDGRLAGFDTEGGAYPYTTVCEPHGGLVTHRTRELAERHAAHPEDWCPVCQVSPRCPHDDIVLRWVDDCWICPKCCDEWSTDVFPVPDPDLMS